MPIFLTITLKARVPGCYPGLLSPLNKQLPACNRGSETAGPFFLLYVDASVWGLHTVGTGQAAVELGR